MTAPSTDDLTGSTDAKAMNRCLLRNLDEANATISALRKAAEGMAEAAREVANTKKPRKMEFNFAMAISRLDAALAAYEATK